jgi:hypothetical protein
MARMKYGQALAQKGRDAEALAEYLWCFDHGDASPSFIGVRLSFLLNYIKSLGTRYPAAEKALESRRDERQAKVLAGSTDLQTILELISFNTALDQKEKNLAVFDQLPAGGLARDTVCGLIIDQLLAAKRYADILGGKDGRSAFGLKVDQFNRMLATVAKDSPTRARMEENFRKYTVACGAHSFEALAGLKQNAEGKELAQQILKFDSSPETRATLAEAADRAGNAELAQFVKQ